MTMSNDDFATTLRRLRRAAGLTQEELAAASGLSVEGISALERGQRRRPHGHTVDALIDALGPEVAQTEELRASARPPRPNPTTGGAPTPVGAKPQQVPAPPPTYVGRAGDIDMLAESLTAGTAPRRVAITGMGGVGKSAMAMLLAHQVAGHYPDGQIYLDLAGQGGREPVSVQAALTYVLTSLGGKDVEVAADPELAKAQLRTATSAVRVLLVLDNASGPGQVEPLLPASADSGVIITSRQSFDGVPDIEHRPLGLLAENDARQLLEEVVGPERLAADPDATTALVAVCAGLPLALRLVGGRLRARPSWPVKELADQLSGDPSRMVRLRHGEVEIGRSLLGTVDQLAAGTDHADHDAATAMHVVGLLPSPVVSAVAIAGATGWDLSRAESAIERLVHLSLIEEPLPGRYRAHDLVHAVACARAVEDAGSEAMRGVRVRVLTTYRAVAWRARSLTRSAPVGIDEAEMTSGISEFGDALACVDLIADDIDQITILVKEVATYGDEEAVLAAQVVLGMITYYVTRADSSGWSELIEGVLERLPAGAAAESTALHLDLALFHAVRGRLDATLEHTQVVIEAAQHSGDVATETAAHSTAATAWRRTGELRQAERSCLRALELSLQSGDTVSRARAYRDLGLMRFRLGEHQSGLAAQREALALYEEIGAQRGIAMALINVGVMLRDTGELAEARECLERGAQVAREVLDRPLEAEALEELGYWHVVSGQPGRGMEILQDGLVRVEVRGGHRGEAGLRHRLGLALNGLGRREEAVEHWQLAVRLHEQEGDHGAAADVRRLLNVMSVQA